MTTWRSQPYSPLMIAAVVAIIANILMLLIISIANAVSPRPEVAKCVTDEAREKIQKLVTDGIDEALKNHTKKMFEVWIQDDTDQPRRAVEGMKSGIRAYIRSRAATLHWEPPVC